MERKRSCNSRDAAAQFYSEVFGWTIDSGNAMGYRTIGTEAGGIAGGIYPAPRRERRASLSYLSRWTTSTALSGMLSTSERGSSVVSTLPDGGRMAVLQDLKACLFALMARKTSSAPVPR